MTAASRLARLSERVPRRRRRDPLADPGVSRTELSDRRAELAARFAELQWDLGGLAYEMASRDHFRMDVLVGQAARLQEVDAELGAVERLLRMEHAAATGSCPACGALHARGAVFCWRCGEQLMRREPGAAQ